MFCRNCGREVSEKAEICIHCGARPLNGVNYCQHCGAEVNPNAEICIKCGVRLVGVKSVAMGEVIYAGFWRRFVASLVDGVILFVPMLIINLIFPYAGWFLGTVASWLYYALMECSERQATLGKQVLGIMVTDSNGNRITFGRATGRHFAKIVSSLTLLIGYIMAGFTEKKQALHDMIADCLVIKKS
ncbi:MAG: RDD family protein [candidate division WOR-3 bacterium]|nr:RDD family protein [candidate division WOR-3 bacterium]